MNTMTVDERYEHFFTNPERRRDTSLRLEGCRALVALVEQRHAKNVLDIGSGVTSHMLRAMMNDHSNLHVVTTDTSLFWLRQTFDELRRDGLNFRFMHEQSQFEREVARSPNRIGIPFDLISVDGGNLDYRVDNLPLFASWLSADGALFLDDFGMRDYEERATQVLTALGMTVTKLEETLDEHGFWVAIAEYSK